MLDICIPIHIPNVHLAIPSIEAIEKSTDIPFRVIITVDGGSSSDTSKLMTFLAASKIPKLIFRLEGTYYFAAAAAKCLDHVIHDLVAFVPPQVVIHDPKWVGKLQAPFTKDPMALISGADHATRNSTLLPYRLNHHNHMNTDLFMIRKSSIKGCQPKNVKASAYSDVFFRNALRVGGTGWNVPSVRYDVVEHSPHERKEHARSTS